MSRARSASVVAGLALLLASTAFADVLVHVEPRISGAGNVTGLAMSPAGTEVYASVFGGSVRVYGRDGATGVLTLVQTFNGDANCPDVGPGSQPPFKQASSIAVSGDGANVYVTSQFHDSIVALARANDGTVSCVGVVSDGTNLRQAHGVSVSADGTSVYAVTGGPQSRVTVYARNTGTGVLSSPASYPDGGTGGSSLGSPSDSTVSPDDANVYVTGSGDSALTTFARASLDGSLSSPSALVDGVGGTDGLAGASAVAASADGLSVYATGETDDAIAVFSRGVGGALTWVELQQEGVGGVSGLDGVLDVVVSPDGTRVYGLAPGALSVFARDAGTSALTFLQAITTDLTNLLAGARSLAVSPDGDCVYAGTALGVIEGYCYAPADLGDAPAPYPTLLVDGGAAQATSAAAFLGAGVDAEDDGLPSTDADGDDLDATDDEDGVTFDGQLVADQSAEITVVVGGTDPGAVLEAWVDFNGDGDWTDLGERVLTAQAVTNGSNTLSLAVPIGATTGDTLARFRLHRTATPVVGPDGPGGAGEVEDYPVHVYGATDTQTVSVTVDGTGAGTVTSAPPGLVCTAGTCTYEFGVDTEVTLSAAADAGSEFAGWSGDCTGTGDCVLTMDADKAVTATFEDEYPVTVTVTGAGSVSSDVAGIVACTASGGTCTASFALGSTVTLSATADPNNGFAGWSGAGCSGTGDCVLTIDGAKSVSASFLPATDISVSVVDGSGLVDDGGAVSVAMTVANTGAVGVSGVKLDATMPSGVTAVTWTCTASGGATTSLTCDGSPQSGDIAAATVDLPASSQLAFAITGTAPTPARGAATTSAELDFTSATPAFLDVNAFNDASSDLTRYVVISVEGFESGASGFATGP